MSRLRTFGIILVTSVVLGATAFRDSIVRAAQTVEATITNVDANGNVKTHEQGVAAVSGTVAATQAGLWTVSGGVAATQSGSWNVGITGTPSVTISGTPSVNIANNVAVKNVDEKGRVPYMQGGFASCAAGNAFCDTTYPAVPAQKRLVVEHVSANIGLFNGSTLNGTFLLGPGVTFSLFGRSMATPELVGVNEQVLAYYDAGATPVYRLVFSSSTGSGAVSSVLSGYLVDLTQ